MPIPTFEEFRKELRLVLYWNDHQVCIPIHIVGTKDLQADFIYSSLKLYKQIGGTLPDDSQA